MSDVGIINFGSGGFWHIAPNQSLEPMARCVTPRAKHESRRLSPWLTIER